MLSAVTPGSAKAPLHNASATTPAARLQTSFLLVIAVSLSGDYFSISSTECGTSSRVRPGAPYLAAENAVRIRRIADDEGQHDRRADEHEPERAWMRRRVPDGEPVDHHIRKQAVSEAGEGQHEDRHRAGEGLGVGFPERPPHPQPRRKRGE